MRRGRRSPGSPTSWSARRSGGLSGCWTSGARRCCARTRPTSRRPRDGWTPARSIACGSTTAASRRSRTGCARPPRCLRSSARSGRGSWRMGLASASAAIPVGVVGANFEARPNVAVDVASQVLKSGNAVVLRTGGAALGTVRVLVDEVLRPALEETGLPAEAVGLVRSPERAGAEALVSLPDLIPLVILRGSGESTAALERLAAANGVRTLAHAEGGGVLYVHASAAAETLAAVAHESLDRLGVCNRLNLALVDRAAAALVPTLLEACREREVEVRATERAERRRRPPPPRPATRARMGGRAGAGRHGHARSRRRSRRGGADRERGDVGPRGRDRGGGRGGRNELP